MARLERVTTTRYLLAGRHVPKGTPGAVKARRKTKHWYGVGVPGQPKTRRVKLSTDKAVARRMLDDLVRGHERGRAGLPDDAAAAKPLLEHLSDYAEAVALGLASGKRRRGAAPGADFARHSAKLPAALFAGGLGYASCSDFGPGTPTAVARLLARRVALPKADGGWSRQTANNYLAAARRFVAWLAARRVGVAADLLDAVPGFDAANHRTRVRRECPPGDLRKLLDAASEGGVAYDLTGPQRYALYACAWGTGFRAKELAGLTVAAFDLSADPPAVTVQGRGAKNGRTARQPLPAGVAAALETLLAGRPPNAPAWPGGSWAKNTAKMIRVDLEAGGVPYSIDTPAGPAVLDFHALRHSFVTALARTGTMPAELQRLARHSTSRLTMDVYAHAGDAESNAAVGRLDLPGAAAIGASAPTYAELVATVADLREQLRVAVARAGPE